jgi:hypothetical protein
MRDEETGDGTRPSRGEPREKKAGEGGRELPAREVTKRLKISYQALYRLVHDHNVPLRREGTGCKPFLCFEAMSS